MKNIWIERAVPSLLALLLSVAVPPPAEARYADDFDGSYDDLNCSEDDCDCLEPDSNRFKVVSPSNFPDTGCTVVFTGAYDQVQAFFEDRVTLRQAGSNSYRSKLVAGCRSRCWSWCPFSFSWVRVTDGGRVNQVMYRDGFSQAGSVTFRGLLGRTVSRVSKLPSVSRDTGTASGRL